MNHITRRAYTLIEMMIAIGLGTVICSVAFAALRLSSQSISLTNRLSIENGLLRSGVYAALDELDSWTNYDDPSNLAQQPLRKTGEPFMDLSAAGLSDKLFDFDQSHAGNWWRGDGSIWNAPQYGDYSLLANLAHEDVDMRRYGERIRDLSANLGYYSLIDYVPANEVYSFFDASGKVPDEFSKEDMSENHIYNKLGIPVGYPRDFMGITQFAYFTVTTEPTYLSKRASHRYFGAWSNDGDPTWTQKSMFDTCMLQLPIMLSRPSHWPDLKVSVMHFHSSARQWHTAKIVVVSPMTGESIKLFFSTTSTTLRGARRQRGLDPLL